MLLLLFVNTDKIVKFFIKITINNHIYFIIIQIIYFCFLCLEVKFDFIVHNYLSINFININVKLKNAIIKKQKIYS